MQYVKLDDVVKLFVNLKANENTALYKMDETVRVYNEAIDDCIDALRSCNTVVLLPSQYVEIN